LGISWDTICKSNQFWFFRISVHSSLQKGMLADLTILDRDLLTCPAGEIAGIQVMRTIVGGRTVHQK